MKKVLILDGDTVAYRCSAANEERSILVQHTPTGKEKVFKHRTEFKESMQERGKEITDDYVINDVQTPQPIEYALSTVKNHINRLKEQIEADEVIIYAGEQFNFRLDLPLPKKYKGNRANNIRPVHLKECKEYLRKHCGAKEAIGYEVDDACCIAAYDNLKAGNLPIMYFYEKDQMSFNGITLLVEDDSGFKQEVIPSLGYLTLGNNNTVKGAGIKFLAYQWVCYDKVDNYCAYDLSDVKYGPSKAYNMLKGLQSEKEVLEAVAKQFQKFYPKEFKYTDWKGEEHEADYKTMLDLYFKCARMKRSKDDPLDFRELMKEYDAKY